MDPSKPTDRDLINNGRERGQASQKRLGDALDEAARLDDAADKAEDVRRALRREDDQQRREDDAVRREDDAVRREDDATRRVDDDARREADDRRDTGPTAP